MWNRIRKSLELAGHGQTIWTILSYFGFPAIILGTITSLFATSQTEWSVGTVWLVSLVGGLVIAMIAVLSAFTYAFLKAGRSLAAAVRDGDHKKKENLELKFGNDGQFYDIPKHGLYTITRQLSIRLCNNSATATASDCKVQITAIEPASGIKLPRILKESFALAPGDSIFIPLASYGEARNPEKFNCADTLIEIFGGDQPISIDHDYRSVITIRATAIETPFCEEQCVMWVNESGRLKIEKVNDNEGKSPLNGVIESRTLQPYRPVVPVYYELRGQVQHDMYAAGDKLRIGPDDKQFTLRFSSASSNCVHMYKDNLSYLARIRGRSKGETLKVKDHAGTASSFVISVGEHFLGMNKLGQMIQGKIVEVKYDGRQGADHHEVIFDYQVGPIRGGDFVAI